jgi:hypothetical protein
LVFLRSVGRLLVTASVVPSSPVVTLMKEALSSSEMSVLTRAAWRNIPEDITLRLFHLHSSPKYETLPTSRATPSWLGCCVICRDRNCPSFAVKVMPLHVSLHHQSDFVIVSKIDHKHKHTQTRRTSCYATAVCRGALWFIPFAHALLSNAGIQGQYSFQTPWPLVCKKTTPTERKPLVGKVSANF